MDGGFFLRWRRANAIFALRKAGLPYEESQSPVELEAILAAANLATQSAIGLYSNNGFLDTTTETAPSGTAGYIGALVTTNGLVIATKIAAVAIAANRTGRFHGIVTLGTTNTGNIELGAVPVVSVDGGATWTAIARLFSAKVAGPSLTAQVMVQGDYKPTTNVTAIFGVLIGNVDNTAVVTCLGGRRDLRLEVI